MNDKTIVITGGTGFLGKYLAKYFITKGYHIFILSRSAHANEKNITYLQWDGKTLDNWVTSFEGAEAIINLAGKSVNCRYTKTNKRIIKASRIHATTVVGQAIQQCKTPPKVWLNGGSATIYRYSEDLNMSEQDGVLGEGFSVDVCKAWEQTFNNIPTPTTRKVFMRISIVLGDNGGVMGHLKHLVCLGLGGTQGHGRQFVSWLHLEDYGRIVEYLINQHDFNGVVNCVSPNPVTNHSFMKALRKKYNVPIGLPQPKWLLEIGAIIIRTDTELILKSRKVVPTRLLENGFKFKYPNLENALTAI